MYRSKFFRSLTVFALIILIFSQFDQAKAIKLNFGGHTDDNFWTVDTLYCRDGIGLTAQQTTLDVDHKAFWLELGASSIPLTITPGVDPSARIGHGDGTAMVNNGNPYTVFFFFTSFQTPGTAITTEIWRWDHGNQTTEETGEGDDNTHFDDIMTDNAVIGDCYVDQTPPTTSITQSPPASTNSISATFSFSGTDNATATENLTYLCWLDSGPWQSCTTPVTFTNLTVATHSLWVTAFDQAGNYDPNYANYVWTVVPDSTPPAAVSSIRASPNPTAAASVDFTVTFSEPVTGVDASDFNLTTTGVSGAAVSGVSGSDSIYIVTINTGSGNGNIRLNVVDDDTVKDLALNPLGAGFTSGEIYTIIRSATFTDAPLNYWANSYIEILFNAGITGGCSVTPLNYCPDNIVTRAQMAVFLLKGMHSSSYAPPAVGAGTGFNDVATSYWAASWIKQLAAEGITGGCGSGNYCPDATVTRAQIAIFLLKAKHGSVYTPPNATGIFTDVPVGYWADKWIEQLAAEIITGGCGAGIYCPDSPVTRAQMAVFLVKTFNLP